MQAGTTSMTDSLQKDGPARNPGYCAFGSAGASAGGVAGVSAGGGSAGAAAGGAELSAGAAGGVSGSLPPQATKNMVASSASESAILVNFFTFAYPPGNHCSVQTAQVGHFLHKMFL
jgi:hypothetical protein